MEREARLTRWLEVITLIGVYGGLLMPLVYARVVVFPFVYLKMLYFQILVGTTFAAFATLALREPRYRPRASWLLWGLCAWYGAMGASSIFAVNPVRAFFGTQERMTGLFSLLHFFAWYLMATSMLRSSRDWRRLLDFQIGVGVISAGASLLQLKFPNLIGSGEVIEGERLSGLLGNPIYVGAYQAFCVFIIGFLWREASPRKRVGYVVALVASLIAFALAGSRGPLLGLVVGLGVATALLVVTQGHRKLVLMAATGASVVVGSYLIVATLLIHRPALEAFWASHANIKHFFEFQVDPSRILLWTAAWDGFLNRPILGWGPAGYEMAFDAMYRPSYHTLGMNDEAHNRVLGVMCETGVIGLLTFLAVWVGYFATVIRAMNKGGLAPLASAALIGAGVGHFVQFLFAFDTPATQLMTFLVFAVASAALASAEPLMDTERSRSNPAKWVPFGTVPAVVAVVVVFGSGLPLASSVYAKRAAAALSRNEHDVMLDLLTRSQRLATPYLDDQLLVVTRAILQVTKSKKLDEWDRRKEALTLTNTISEQYLAKNKAHARLRRVYAGALLAIGKTYTSSRVLNKAELLYKQNLADSPKRQRYLLDYARFEVETGHQNDAEGLLRQAVALDSSMGEPRWELGKFIWTQLKRADEGAQMMADAGVDLAHFNGITHEFMPTDVTEWQQLAQVCSRTGQIEKLRAITNAVRDLAKQEHRAFEPQLGIARYMEKSGLIAERDQVLRYTLSRNPKLAQLVDPVLSGRTSLAAQQAASESIHQAKPSPSTHASKAEATEAQFSLARTP